MTPLSTPFRRRALTAVVLLCVAAATVILVSNGGGATGEAPPSEPGRVIWNGDVSTGDLSQYALVQQCAPDRTTVVPDPLGGDRKAIRFRVADTDVKPCTPTINPRAQALSPSLLEEGEDYWVGYSVLVPRDFPVTRQRGDNWISLASIYGPPYKGAGPSTMYMNTSPGVNRFYYRRNGTSGYDTTWSMPLVRGRWVDFAIHVRLSRSAKRGFREQWVNAGSGWRRSRFNGRKSLATATIDAANNRGANFSKVSLYFRRGILRSGTLYFADHKIGTSFRSVAPTSYDDV